MTDPTKYVSVDEIVNSMKEQHDREYQNYAQKKLRAMILLGHWGESFCHHSEGKSRPQVPGPVDNFEIGLYTDRSLELADAFTQKRSGPQKTFENVGIVSIVGEYRETEDFVVKTSPVPLGELIKNGLLDPESEPENNLYTYEQILKCLFYQHFDNVHTSIRYNLHVMLRDKLISYKNRVILYAVFDAIRDNSDIVTALTGSYNGHLRGFLLVAVALYFFLIKNDSAKTAILEVAKLGDKCDLVAKLTGEMFGATYGERDLPLFTGMKHLKGNKKAEGLSTLISKYLC